MKRGVFILLLFCTVHSFAQKKSLAVKRADKYYNQFAYIKAKNLYKQVLAKESNQEVQLKLAQSYIKLNQPDSAVVWYEKGLKDQEDVDSVHYINYANALASTGNYQESKQWYIKYKEKVGTDRRSDKRIYSADHIDEFFKDSSRYEISSLNINTPEYEFAPSYYKEGLVFASSRTDEIAIKHYFSWDMKNFLNLYYAEINEDSSYVEPFDNTINSKFHEGATSFNHDFTTIFFTRNNYVEGKAGTSSKGVNKINLYSAEKGNDGWENINSFQYNSPEFSTGDPFLADNGKVIYFASDRPGGYGGTDLYKTVFVLGNGWSSPVNLGPEVNTEGNERSPFLSKEGTLYFASDGHLGLGSLDIYEAKEIDSLKYIVKNMGYPINTSRDDFALIIDDDEKTGFFTSNREGGKGKDDIYKLLIKEAPKVPVIIKSFVKIQGDDDTERTTLANTKVVIYNKTEEKEEEALVTSEVGLLTYALKPGFDYEIRGTKDSLIGSDKLLSLLEVNEQTSKTVELILEEPLPDVFDTRFVMVDDQGEPLDNAVVYLINKDTGEIKVLKSDEKGSIKALLKPETAYVFKGMKKGYFTNCVTLKTPPLTKGKKDLKKPFVLEKISLNKAFEIELYFDVSKHNIRPDAAIQLDEVVAFLTENPGLQVELGSHTDARGSDTYNQALSQKRAESSVNYIVSKGIDPKYIAAKGYGETQIKNECKNGVRCPDSKHQVNRRTEIKVTGVLDEDHELSTSQYDISNLFDVTNSDEDCLENELINLE